MRVYLGQAIVVVAGGKVFCLEAAWDGMEEKDKERFRQAAAKGSRWIDRKEGAPVIPENLTRGGRWCAHKGYTEEARRVVRDPDAVAFGVSRPSQQSAGTVVVGRSSQANAQYCGTCGGATEASRQCSPNGSEFGGEEFAVEQSGLGHELADRPLRQESEEKDTRDADRQLR